MMIADQIYVICAFRLCYCTMLMVVKIDLYIYDSCLWSFRDFVLSKKTQLETVQFVFSNTRMSTIHSIPHVLVLVSNILGDHPKNNGIILKIEKSTFSVQNELRFQRVLPYRQLNILTPEPTRWLLVNALVKL